MRISRATVSPGHLGVAAVAIALAASLALPGAAAGAPRTRRVSVSSAGVAGNGVSFHPAISADGRLVAFTSQSDNLVGNDGNGFYDVFVRDLKTHRTKRVSVSSNGTEADGHSFNPSISANGRFVAFQSEASNLGGTDTKGFSDVFVRDLKRHRTRRVSVSRTGGEADADSYDPVISADGRSVAFESLATNLVGNDGNSAEDVFVRNLRTHKTRRVSVSSAGVEGDSYSLNPSISADGRFIAFYSDAQNLVPHDTKGFTDIFVRDLRTHRTKRVSVSSAGTEGNDNVNGFPSISADGRFVAFGSNADNLIPADGNGFGDVFMRDRKASRTTRVSVSSSGAEGDGSSFLVDPPVIGGDGRYVAFISTAHDFATGVPSGEQDFLRDRKTRKTKLLNVSSSGTKGDGNSWDPTLTPDGRFAAFVSSSTNIAGTDGNGDGADIFVRGPLYRRHHHHH